jgi:hypothetical protein
MLKNLMSLCFCVLGNASEIDVQITISILEYIVIRSNLIFHIHKLFIASSSIHALFIILYFSFDVHNFDTPSGQQAI